MAEKTVTIPRRVLSELLEELKTANYCSSCGLRPKHVEAECGQSCLCKECNLKYTINGCRGCNACNYFVVVKEAKEALSNSE